MLLGPLAAILVAAGCGRGDSNEQSPTSVSPAASDSDFVGAIGPFAVGTGSYARFCDPAATGEFGTVTDRTRIAASQLFVTALAENVATALGCADGTIYCMTFAIGTDTARRCYFNGQAPAGIGAPRERIEETEVSGKSALAEAPAATSPGEAIVTVLERAPDGGTPGIVLTVESMSGLDRATHVAEAVTEGRVP